MRKDKITLIKLKTITVDNNISKVKKLEDIKHLKKK